jgi:hypothetical protein
MLRSSKPWCPFCALGTVGKPKDALRWFPNVRLTMWELLNFIENSRSSKSSKSFFGEKLMLVFIIVGKLSMSKISQFMDLSCEKYWFSSKLGFYSHLGELQSPVHTWVSGPGHTSQCQTINGKGKNLKEPRKQTDNCSLGFISVTSRKCCMSFVIQPMNIRIWIEEEESYSNIQSSWTGDEIVCYVKTK